MAYVADLHIHSRFSRACSRELNIPNLSRWAKLKGINLMGTGDCLQPLWSAELKKDLNPSTGSGQEVYEYDGVYFLPTAEVACIYSDKGKVRRIHIVIVLPTLEAAGKLAQALTKRGVNIISDGRPMMGLSSRELCETVFSIEPEAIIIPAHCVLPSTLIHTHEGMKKIKDIKEGDLVYTHKNRKRKVLEVIKHNHNGKLYKIQPWYFSPGLESTPEHPFYAFKTDKCPTTGDKCLPSIAHKRICKHSLYKHYFPNWVKAEDLQVGDILVFPRFTNTTPMSALNLPEILPYKSESGIVSTGGTRGYKFSENLVINEDFCRLVGYYLAEGWVTSHGEIGFCFNSKETEYIEDVKNIFKKVFDIKHHRVYKRSDSEGIELLFSSQLLVKLFSKLFYSAYPYRANNKTLPDWILHLPTDLQAHILLGWWRGDGGYTTSRLLMNQIKVICLRLGVIPSIGFDSVEKHLKRGNHNYKNRTIKASFDLFQFSNLAFFEDKYNLLKEPVFAGCIRKLSRRHGWIDDDYIYLPIRKITADDFSGEVFNLEVEEDNSYLTEFAAVHNCWTPWFSLFGSESGYDKFEDCFGEFSDQIFAVETGLSSEPAMNWRVSQLDGKSIVSFSDAHSLPRLGREVTIFSGSPTFAELRSALKNHGIIGTIEFFPEEGKYHYSGHRNCGIVYDSKQLKEKGETCPVCKRRLTVGVMQRVEDLSDRKIEDLRLTIKDGITKSEKLEKPGFRMLVQLEEIIAESLGSTVASQKTKNEYHRIISVLGPELKILTKIPIEDIAKAGGAKLAEGISRVREGKLSVKPGYDNTYGVVKIWDEAEEQIKEAEQVGLF